MKESKRYYWLKLYDDFFSSKRIKKLRSIAGGDTYTIIYLKMQLKALKTDGYLYFDGVMNDFAEELALDIDEDIDNVKVTINYLLTVGLMESNAEGAEYKLTYMDNVVGSETASAQRVRDHRNKQKLLQCNTDVTQVKQLCNVEIEKEIEIEKEKNIYRTQNTKKRFAKPSVKEIEDYASENGYEVNAQYFFDYYEANGWKIGKNPMKDWKATVRNWSRNNKNWEKKVSKLPDFENPYKQEVKKEPELSPEEAKEWYDSLIKELKENGTIKDEL